MSELQQRAVEHHNKSLMKFKGWRPWQKLIQSCRKQVQTADAAFNKSCLRLVESRQCFTLHCYVQKCMSSYKILLLRYCTIFCLISSCQFLLSVLLCCLGIRESIWPVKILLK